MIEYVPNYLKAIEEPLPELKTIFEAELDFFQEFVNLSSRVLDVGCGAGRPAVDLASSCKEIVAIDNNADMLAEARVAVEDIPNISILDADALALPFDDEEFDFIYGTYNLLGGLSAEERQQAVNEMHRVAKTGSRVASLTWKNDEQTTRFLNRYYPSIGIDIISSDEQATVTSKGTFERLSGETLQSFYAEAGFKDIQYSN